MLTWRGRRAKIMRSGLAEVCERFVFSVDETNPPENTKFISLQKTSKADLNLFGICRVI